MKMRNPKNLVVFFTEIALIALMVFGFLPNEASLVLTAILIFYFIFSPIEDSLWVFIASIPLFVALPITESFDSMANWRILLAVLFLVLFFRHGISTSINRENGKWKLKEKFKHERMGYLFGLFILIGCLSLLAATNVIVGIKKIAFLINIALLYVIIRNVIFRNQAVIPKIVSALKTAIATTLIVGYAQLLAVCFVPLYSFWQFWAKRVIPVFYGHNLSALLSYSNTWFSYYSYQLPTLRMFSIFPDSHSFAFFCILSLPFFLCSVFLRQPNQKKETANYYFPLIICLLAILFSGSRGAWASALSVFVVLLTAFIAIVLHRRGKKASTVNALAPLQKNYKIWRSAILLMFGCLIIFFFLLPISSGTLLLTQKIQMGKLDLSQISLFERAKSITDIYEISAKSRLQIWQKSIDALAKRPFLGVGIGNYPLVLNESISAAKKGASAHNLYLDFATEMGVFALVVLLAIFWQILRTAWLGFRGIDGSYLTAWAGFFVLALLWILSYSLFDIVLLNDKVLLFFVANLAVLYRPPSAHSA